MVPKISVIIPVYNVEQYLPYCLDSIVGQTLRDIEIICVNDGSTDGSLAILKHYAAQDGRIRIISQQNMGPGCARNTGLDVAQGEYVLFVDSDDWIDEDYCQKLYEAAIRHDAEVACAGMARCFPSRSSLLFGYDKETVCENNSDKFTLSHCPPYFYTVIRLVRREALLRIGLRFREHMVCEDMEYTLRLLNETRRLVTVPGPCYRYRMHNASITRSSQTPDKQAHNYNARKAMLAYADTHGISLAPRYRQMTVRFWKFYGITLFKVKEFDGVRTGRLFDLFPLWFSATQPIQNP